MNYKPYSPEWHRYRYLKEAVYQYLDDYVDNEVIVKDILNIVCERQERAHAEYLQVRRFRTKTQRLKCYLPHTVFVWISICRCIANKEDVPLEDMIWAEKLAKAHTLARDWLNKARRQIAHDIEVISKC